MGTEVFERAQGRSFAQNVTRTRRGEAALSYFTLSHALHQVESVSAGPLGLCYRALPVCWTGHNIFIRKYLLTQWIGHILMIFFITKQSKSFFFFFFPPSDY